MAGPGGHIILTDADDHFPGVGDDNSGNEQIDCLMGNDSVLGGLGNDTIYGGLGDDDILGDQNDDFLTGDDGNDALQGGSGNDIIWDLLGSLTNIDAGSGNDNVQIGAGFGVFSVINGGAGYDALTTSTTFLQDILISGFEELNTFGARITATATQFAGFRTIQSSGEDPSAGVSLGLYGLAGVGYALDLTRQLDHRSVIFIGSFGNDTLTTGQGDDLVFGDLGNDALTGGRGNDSLRGSSGADTLTGGLGRDVMTGGSGADRFVFADDRDSPASGRGDRIIDFGHGGDKLDLSAMPGLFFNGSAGFHLMAGEVIFAQDVPGGVTSVLADLTGDGVADLKVVLAGLLSLDAGDFLF